MPRLAAFAFCSLLVAAAGVAAPAPFRGSDEEPNLRTTLAGHKSLAVQQTLYEMGRASQQANNPGRAVQNFDLYLQEDPRGADHGNARFHLGEAHRDTGQVALARRTWTDLARDLEAKNLTKDASEIRARSTK